MTRRSLWAGLVVTVAVAAGVTVWALPSPSTVPSESKHASATRNNEQTNALLQSALDHQSHQDSQGAARDYRHVLELDPGNKQAWYGLGLIEQQNGRTAEARAAYEKALDSDPSFMSALYSEANLLRSSDPDRAIELLRRAVAADPKGTAVQMQLGFLLTEQHRKDEAVDVYRHVVEIEHGLLSQVPKEFRDSVSRSSR
ncbi:tetratricopeptide repeat protein [Streptomyces sp. HUAS TT20]|uniref:tetratricopeptide repeat protein n=1 Tax=Streptomyces sp. HUAS TT20 TaxID=3447509 RepID=UPI0021D8F01E|nr:tetratricopeptide repeat protein [Streptomyces sp. HUAS 15-9]UXY29599.1 tetratricopeptide repeat protein [Streptomyces sp. HUAS 15-9]